VSVAVDGDTIVVGASLDDANDNGVRSGSGYVFTRSGTVWAKQEQLTASDGDSNDSFGVSVAVDGDTIVIGAALNDANDNGADSGSAYVFTRNGVVWSQQGKLTASDGASDDSFGVSVAVDGDTIVVGASLDDANDNGVRSGSGYVFTRSGTVWAKQEQLVASDGASEDFFGRSVAVSGDTIVIAAPYDDDNGFDSGSVYIYSTNAVPSPAPNPAPNPTPNPVPNPGATTTVPTMSPASMNANDFCAAAQGPLIPDGILVTGSTVGSSFDNVGFCGTSNTGPGIWFFFVGTGERFTADTCNSRTNFDTKLSIFAGFDCNGLVCLDGVDDGCGLQSSISFDTELGETYWILLHGWGMNAAGNYGLTLSGSTFFG
jgi:hypothetical protein